VNLSNKQPKPQAIDYQNLERIWGQEANQIPVPVREIIAGVLRRVREDSPKTTSSDHLYCAYPLPSPFIQFPVI
jgi:hypothetical protein